MSLRDRLFVSDDVETSPSVGDEIKHTTCYMCACRCGIRVYMQDGKVRFIQGNSNHPVNKGVLCAKGSAGIMQHYSPARLRKPLKRVGPRGSGEFVEIEWDEALETATDWLSSIRKDDPRKLAFFTGRDQSQALTGWWASQYGTPNYAAHGGFCSASMAAAGLYTIGGSFWEFGEPDWDRTKYFMLFGVAEDHDSNPIKAGIAKVKEREGAKMVSVNPIRTGYSAVADEWLGIRPGTDGLFIMALIQELIAAGKVDFDFLVRYTNAPWLVVQNPGGPDDGLFVRNDDAHPMAWDKKKNAPVDALATKISPALVGEFEMPDGRKVVPAFQLLAGRALEKRYAPAAVAETTGIPAATIKRIAAELAHVAFEEEITVNTPWTDWAGRRHRKFVGRPVSMHAMRGISGHTNGFQTCRAIHILQILLGSIDCPGGFRYKAPYPKPAPPPIRPFGKAGEVHPETPLPGLPLGFPMGPEDLLVEPDGSPRRIDKAFSWEHPFGVHGMMHMVISNAWRGDPYPIDTLMMFMANMSWNSSMNTSGVMQMLTDKDEKTGGYKIPRIIYSDAYFSEMVAYADLILPDTTYLERHDCVSLLDRPIGEADGVADAIRHPVVEPDRDVRPFQSVLIDLGARLGLPDLVNDDGSPKYPGGYPDYLVNHERTPGVGLLAGWRGADGKSEGKGEPNPKQLDAYIENECFWRHEFPEGHRFFKMANRGYLEWAAKFGLIGSSNPVIFQLYLEPLQKFRLAADGHGDLQPPGEHRDRLRTYFDPLPIWYAPFEEEMVDTDEFPLHALTQRPMQMYHSWGSQNAWLRQILGRNYIYMHPDTAARYGIDNEDWIWITSHLNRVRAQARLMDGVNPGVIWTWNAIGKKKGAWTLSKDAEESRKGFLLNHVISELLPVRAGEPRYSNSDPITGQAAWFDLRVRIEKAAPDEQGETWPQFDAAAKPPGIDDPPDRLTYGWDFRKAREGRK
jgi:sulfite dehydrogenase (quinone) subunit SoeA